MEIIRAEILGFCFGVRRTVELAEKALSEYKNQKIYSLGPLIHNEEALNYLGKKGLQVIEEAQISQIESGAVVIIRAHGVAPDIINQLNEKKCIVIDATCPRVKASQKMVEKSTLANDYVILTGDKNHGEVIGIAGYADKKFILIQNEKEAEKADFSVLKDKNVILLSQTTYSSQEFSSIEKIVRSRVPNLTVYNTICPATKERQNSLKDLCSKVDGVLVIGGANSANTIRLFQTAEQNCKFAAHIQTVKDIPTDFFKLKKIGITAGSSTPDFIIDQVVAFLTENQ